MTTKNLLETASLVETSSDDSWKVRIISEGRGSSGIYPAELLQKYFTAFSGPVLSYENHPNPFEGPQSRNFTQIVGKIQGEAWVDTDENGRVGVYANYVPDPEYRDRLERYKDSLGLSIYIEGDGYENEDGDFVVTSFNALDPFKSVDVVLAAGRGGRFEESLKEMYSRRRAESEKPDTTSVQEGKETEMDEETKGLINSLISSVQTLVSAQETKAEEAAQKDADETAVAQAIEAYDAAVKAIDEADLFPEQVTALRAEAKAGVDVTEKIAEAKAIKDAAVKHVQESAKADPTHEGRLFEGTVKSATELGKVFG